MKIKDKFAQLTKIKPDYKEIMEGYCTILPNGCLFIENPKEWYRTSPIQSSKKIKQGYEFKTLNSTYRVRILL